jgi:6-methylsalicylate decarboxylase
MAKQRIDVHTPFIPPFWAEELKSHGGDPSGWGSPEWNPEQLLRFMDDEGISVSVLSSTSPGVEGWEGDARIEITCRVNDYGAELIEQRSERFGYLLCPAQVPSVPPRFSSVLSRPGSVL